MYSSTRIIDSRMALGPAESYVRSNSSPTEVVQGRYLRPEDVGKTMDIEPITFQTLNGGLGVWLIDVLHGRAVIESPDTEFHEIKAYRRLSWKIRWPGYLHFSVGFTNVIESNRGNNCSGSHTRFEILKAAAELIRQFMESAQDVGHDREDWWTIGKNNIDIEHVRIMSLDWRHDDGTVLVPRLWVAGKAESHG